MKQVDTRNKWVRRRTTGNELGIILDAFAKHLHQGDYAPGTVSTYVGTATHFGRWMRREGYQIRDIDEKRICEFCQVHLPRCRCRRPSDTHTHVVRQGLRQLVGFLRQRKLCPLPARTVS